METHSSTPAHRKLIRHIKSKPLKTVDPFCSADLDLAIQETKNSPALGPDGLSNMHLKHIGPAAKEFLLFTFNLSIARSQIPSMWKKNLINPLSKPGKPANEAKSYRPISLLCAASKIWEKLLASRLVKFLQPTRHQHGFRARHSTVTAFGEICEDIAAGFNERKPPKRTVLVALDLSKAFDMVHHDTLLANAAKTELPSYLLRWLST